jgi:hypothetical protein
MMTTIKAVVQDDRIQWKEDVERVLPKNRPTQVLVTILEATSSGLSPEERGKRRVAALAALRNLASGNEFSTIENPVEWQREARADRELPRRD